MKIFQNAQLHPWNNDRGLTLIEAMVGMLVFTIGVLAVTLMTAQSNLGYAKSRQSTQEVNATTMSIEPLKHSGYGNDNILQDDDERATSDPLKAPGYQNYVEYGVQDNATVSGTKLIFMQNDQVSDTADVTFTLFYTKPEIR